MLWGVFCVYGGLSVPSACVCVCVFVYVDSGGVHSRVPGLSVCVYDVCGRGCGAPSFRAPLYCVRVCVCVCVCLCM